MQLDTRQCAAPPDKLPSTRVLCENVRLVFSNCPRPPQLRQEGSNPGAFTAKWQIHSRASANKHVEWYFESFYEDPRKSDLMTLIVLHLVDPLVRPPWQTQRAATAAVHTAAASAPALVYVSRRSWYWCAAH
jgi:hypothetical protein